VTEVPDSAGLFSPRWSPDGKYLLAMPTDGSRMILYDFKLRNWQQLVGVGAGWPSWTPDGKCVYFSSPGDKEYRVCLSDRKLEHVADMAQSGRLAIGGVGSGWTGLAPDGSVLTTRDASSEEIYALDVKFP
jgi:Tol biopolymer transport system component